MSANKTILVMGCSQSSGAEITAEKKLPDYWDEILNLEDPFEQWYSGEASGKRTQGFFESVKDPRYNEDWLINYDHSWPSLLQKNNSDSYNVISVAKPGSGISWVKHIANLKENYWYNSVQWKNDLIHKMTDYKISPLLDVPTLPDLNNQRYGQLSQIFYPKSAPTNYFKFEDKISNSYVVNIREFYMNWQDKHYKYTLCDFDELLYSADIIIWQLTNEPRLTINNPAHPLSFVRPTIGQIGSFENYLNGIISQIPGIESEKEKYKKLWSKEIEKMAEWYLTNFDYSEYVTDNINFFNSVIRKRKLLNKKNIVCTLGKSQLRPYNFKDRIDYSCIDSFFDIHNIPGFSVEGWSSPKGEHIKERIRTNTWPYSKYTHISAYGQYLIYKKVEEVLNEQ